MKKPYDKSCPPTRDVSLDDHMEFCEQVLKERRTNFFWPFFFTFVVFTIVATHYISLPRVVVGGRIVSVGSVAAPDEITSFASSEISSQTYSETFAKVFILLLKY